MLVCACDQANYELCMVSKNSFFSFLFNRGHKVKANNISVAGKITKALDEIQGKNCLSDLPEFRVRLN